MKLTARNAAPILGALVLAAGCAAAPTAASAAAHHSKSKPPACVVFTIATRTATGHEADAPVTVCGTRLPASQVCTVTGSRPFGAPGSEITCTSVPAR